MINSAGAQQRLSPDVARDVRAPESYVSMSCTGSLSAGVPLDELAANNLDYVLSFVASRVACRNCGSVDNDFGRVGMLVGITPDRRSLAVDLATSVLEQLGYRVRILKPLS